MKHSLLVIIFLASICLPVWAQNATRLAGEITLKSDKVISGNIAEEKFDENLKELNIQLPDGTIDIYHLSEVKQFWVDYPNGNREYYLRQLVQINRAPQASPYLTFSNQPDLKEEALLLKALVLGRLSLYKYREGRKDYFFLKDQENQILPLVTHKYKDPTTEEERIRKDYVFLLTRLTADCQEIDTRAMGELSYSEKALRKLIIFYNECVGQGSEYEFMDGGDKFIFSVLGGVNTVYLRVDESNSSSFDYIPVTDFELRPGLQLGVALEYLFSGQNSPWSFNPELYFRQFNMYGTYDRAQSSIESTQVETEIKFPTLQVNFLFKYAFPKKDRRFSLFGGLLQTTLLKDNSKVTITTVTAGNESTETKNLLNNDPPDARRIFTINYGLIGGLGYRINDKWEISSRIEWREDFANQTALRTETYTGSIMVSYHLLP